MVVINSIKTKITFSVIIMLLVLTFSLMIETNICSKKTMKELSESCLEKKLSGDLISCRNYISKYYGKISYDNGQLIDSNKTPINGRFEIVDEIKSKLGVDATIFVENDNDFTRIVTSIIEKNGNRAIGTKLGTKSAAYESILKKNTYIGEATILGSPYLAAYDPLTNDDNKIIGILFIGIPMSDINATISSNRSKFIIGSSITAIIILILVSIILMLYIGKLLSPLQRLLTMLKSMANGNLTTRVVISSNDEIGSIADAFNKFAEKLQIMIKQITDNALTVATSADELSKLSALIATDADTMSTESTSVASATQQTTTNIKKISATTGEMSNSVNSVAASIEEMSTSLNEISKNCQKELSIADKANSDAHGSIEEMEKLTIATNSIGKIVNVIENISNQTNLLALNATIEAAGAGTFGKGFAVVANEVKELSKKTAVATKEITEQIAQMQNDTESAVKAIQLVALSIEEVNSTSKAIVNAIEQQSSAINEISNNVSTLSTGATDVARNVAESANGLSEVADTIRDVNTEVANTAQGISKVKASAVALAQLSAELRSLLSQFKI